MEDDVVLGRMNGARKRGKPRQRWLDTLKGYASGATISNMRRDARDRAGWRGATTAVARGRMRLEGDKVIDVRRVLIGYLVDVFRISNFVSRISYSEFRIANFVSRISYEPSGLSYISPSIS